MKTLLLAALFFIAADLGAQNPSVLQRGPTAVVSIPLEVPQTVDAWKAYYSSKDLRVWVYATRSPYFVPAGTLAPESGNLKLLKSPAREESGARYSAYLLTAARPRDWNWIFFFPEEEGMPSILVWINAFLKQFDLMDSLEQKGAEVLFPAVLLEK